MKKYNRIRHGRFLFYGLLGILLGLCFIRYALQVNIPLTALLAVSVLIGLLGDSDEIVAMCICCIPLHTSLQYSYVLLFCMLIYLAKYYQSIRLNASIIPVLLMILWELLHCFGGYFSPVTFFANCVPLLLLAILMCCSNAQFDYDFLVRAFSISVAAMCICLLGKIAYWNGFDFGSTVSGLRRLGLDSEEIKSSLVVVGGEQNPNTLGILCVLAITGLLQIYYSGRNRKIDIGLSLFLMIFGALTSSRTYLACLAIMVVLMICGWKGSLTSKLRFVGGGFLVFLTALAMLYLVFPMLLEYYYKRFFVTDITTGRADLMNLYNAIILSNPKILFWGVGQYEFSQKIVEVYKGTIQVPHNGTQELIIAWGIPGMLLFLALWFAMIKYSRRINRKRSLIHYVPILIILAKSQVGQMLTSPYTMLAFSYAYLSMCADLSPRDEKRIFTRTQTIPRGSGHNINQLRRKTNK